MLSPSFSPTKNGLPDSVAGDLVIKSDSQSPPDNSGYSNYSVYRYHGKTGAFKFRCYKSNDPSGGIYFRLRVNGVIVSSKTWTNTGNHYYTHTFDGSADSYDIEVQFSGNSSSNRNCYTYLMIDNFESAGKWETVTA